MTVAHIGLYLLVVLPRFSSRGTLSAGCYNTIRWQPFRCPPEKSVWSSIKIGMASSVTNTAFKTRLSFRQPLNIRKTQRRLQSSTTTHTIIDSRREKEGSTRVPAKPDAFSAPPLARLSTSSILRTLLLSAFFTAPLLFRPGLAVFAKIANSPSAWLNPDRNPLLRATIYPLVYKQFCAGRNQGEIGRTSAEIRRLGFSGVVLCYGKEVQVQADKFVGYHNGQLNTMEAEIAQWADGNIETLDMIEGGDWLGIK